MHSIQPITLPFPLPPFFVLPDLVARILVFRRDNGCQIGDGEVVWPAFQEPVHPVVVQFTVFNTGDMPNAFSVRRRLRDTSGSVGTDPGVERVNVDAFDSRSWQHLAGSAGIYLAEFEIDVKDEIRERETNNRVSFRFVLASAPG